MTDPLTPQERERLMSRPRRAAEVQLSDKAEWFDFWEDGWKAGYEAAEAHANRLAGKVAELEEELAETTADMERFRRAGQLHEAALHQALETLRMLGDWKGSVTLARDYALTALAALAGEDDGPPQPQREGDYL